MVDTESVNNTLIGLTKYQLGGPYFSLAAFLEIEVFISGVLLIFWKVIWDILELFLYNTA